MWIHDGKTFDEDTTPYVGYVYLITCISTGKQYIGKKLFWMMKRKQVKGKVKRVKAESDWRTYWSSSDELTLRLWVRKTSGARYCTSASRRGS